MDLSEIVIFLKNVILLVGYTILLSIGIEHLAKIYFTIFKNINKENYKLQSFKIYSDDYI
jgi:hypothetical protein